MFSLAGRTALIVGIANRDSVAWGCAQALKAQGATLAVTYLNDKAEKFVRPLAEELEAEIILPMEARDPDQMTAVFDAIRERWGRLDVLLHSIAFCPKDDLHGRVIDSSFEGFSLAMDISVHSFLRMIRCAEPLMTDGGACMTVTFLGSTRVVRDYNLMGPVKAALESATRYAAAEMGPKGVTVNVLSPGPLRTRASSGIARFDDMIAAAEAKAPMRRLATIEDVGAHAAYLASPAARGVTGQVHFIDGGASVVD